MLLFPFLSTFVKHTLLYTGDAVDDAVDDTSDDAVFLITGALLLVNGNTADDG